MPADPKLVRDHFLAAAELPATDRAAYLAEHCDDAEMRAAVERLLAAHEEPASVLLQSAPGMPTADYAPITERPGTLVGPYKLMEQIGEGGFGLVFVAEQQEPVRRKVALKVIKPGMDSKQVIARFEAERQALALMDHPNIARVLDAGATEAGRPYFVMELVRGIPITDYCDQNQLSPRERLELFVTVCQAIQHAHQKGIIHRDLKPSNVLVTSHDGKPVAKVIDFGVAKAIHQQLTERTIYTNFAQMVGTPLYMSPEQAEMSGLDIDTRSDIYSLGVLLYELLTGTTPLEKKRFAQAAYDEIRRLIREEEPPRPSQRLSTSDTLPSLAASRKTEPAKLSRMLRGEVDWIVMKALEKDRTRRYETANSLARDVQRYLADEEVEACPPSAAYRLKKFARRHKGRVIAASFVLFALLVGMAGATWGLVRAERARAAAADARREALANEQKALAAADEERRARDREAKQRAIAVEQRARAEKAYDRTRDALDAMTSGVTGDSLGTQAAISADQKKFLTEVLTYYKEFAGEKADDEQTRARTAKAAYRVGMIEHKLGRKEQAINALQSALDEYRKLADDFPAGPGYREELANSHNSLAGPLYELGKLAEAENQSRQALALRAKLAADFPSEPAHRRHLGHTHTNLALVLIDQEKRVEVEEHYRQAVAIYTKLVADFPDEPGGREDLALAQTSLGRLLAVIGKNAEGEDHLRQAIAEQAKLAADFPAVPDYRRQLAMSHNDLGLYVRSRGKRTEAEEQWRQALAIRAKLAADFPAVPAYQIELGGSYCNFANLVREEGRAADSLDWYGKAIAVLETVHRADPRDVAAKQFLRNSLGGRGDAYAALAKHAEAIKDWDRAMELCAPAEQWQVRVRRAASRAQAGLVAEAVAEVFEMTKSSNWDADQWYDFACVYAVASGKTIGKKQEYADQAMTLLRKAVMAGFNDAAHMKQDADLDPLRTRTDFQKLTADLQAKRGVNTKGRK
jgi:serine/threonine protein kinase/tetratricopeptide (TPR) repeat protein